MGILGLGTSWDSPNNASVPSSLLFYQSLSLGPKYPRCPGKGSSSTGQVCRQATDASYPNMVVSRLASLVCWTPFSLSALFS